MTTPKFIKELTEAIPEAEPRYLGRPNERALIHSHLYVLAGWPRDLLPARLFNRTPLPGVEKWQEMVPPEGEWAQPMQDTWTLGDDESCDVLTLMSSTLEASIQRRLHEFAQAVTDDSLLRYKLHPGTQPNGQPWPVSLWGENGQLCGIIAVLHRNPHKDWDVLPL